MNLREFIQTEIKGQLSEFGGMFGGADDTDDFSKHIRTKNKRVNWAEFYKMATDTSGYNPSFEKKYGNLLDRPHVKDALKNTKDFKSFMKHINKFESVNEETVYIDYLNKNKGFKQDRKYFKGKNAYDDAVKWAKKNFEKFNLDMINFESVNEGIWPKSKLADRFEFILSNELKKNFKGFFHVDGYDLYHNDKKVMSINPDTDSASSIVKKLKSKIKESVNEEQLDEKLITFSNRAPYGQIVFMAGGAGSGKGFAIDNFIDAAGFKVRDVDEMKKAVANLNRLGKFSVDKWYKKYGNKLSTKPPKNNPDGLSEKEHIEEFFLGKGYSIADIANPKHKSGGLKNPNNVAALHYIVDVMDLKDKWIINMLKGKENKETLPNLLFDITAKNVKSITDVIQPLIEAGYSSKNIHLIWVLTNYDLSIVQNKKRDRVVPDDILLQTHEGAAKTMWGILTQIKPKGLDGRIDVILNNREETVPFKDSNGNVIKVKQTNISGKQLKNTDKFSSDYGKDVDDAIVVKGFKSLPIKKQGGGIVPEKVWKDILFQWIKDNAPKTIDLSQKIGE